METGVPESVGSYRIEALLGQGGMGAVYQAYDRRLDRRVALKHVRPDSGNPQAARARLRREARAAARLSHPAIVQIFELIESDDGDWIVLELVRGTTLSRRLSEGALPFPEVLALGRQLAEGLAEAHAHDIVHRDLKGENVMVTPSGQVKILDFGLAKPLVRGADDPSISVRGQVLGTGHAMSPEQARGLDVKPKSDLFSLGSLLYEMATGIAPFRGQNLLDTLLRINTHQPPPAHEIEPALPAAFSDLVARLLEKAPELRPRDATEVAQALARFERDRDDRSSSDRPSSDDRRSAQRGVGDAPRANTRVKAAIVLVGGLAAALLAPTLLKPPSGDRTIEEAEATLSAPALYEQGMAYLRRFDRPGNLDRARQSFQRMLVSEPDSAAAYAGLARTHWRHHLESHRDPMLLEQAAAAASHAVDLDPYLADARVSRALVAIEQGRAEDADSDLREALGLEPTHADAHRALGTLNESRGELDAAEQAYRAALESDPDNRIFHDYLGALFVTTGRYEDAERAFQQSIDLAPDSIVGYRNLASTYYLQGRLTEAAEALQGALKIRPGATLYSSLGTIFFSQGLYEKATEAFEKALADAGNNYTYWTNLGDAYRQLPDRVDDAREAYLHASQLLSEQIESKPHDVRLVSRRALVLAKLGAHQRARDEIDRIEPTASADALSLFRMAVALEVCGQRALAIGHLERALDAGFSLPEVRRDPELLAMRADPRFHRLLMRRAPEPTATEQP